MKTGLNVVGLVFQIGGILVTTAGLVATWKGYVPGESLIAPMVEHVRRLVALAQRGVSTTVAVFRRFLRLTPKSTTLVIGSSTITVTSAMGGSVRTRKQFSVLDLSAVTGTDALAELDSRTRELMARVNDTRDRAEDEVARLDTAMSGLRQDQGVIRQEMQEGDKRVATGGVRLQLVALIFVGFGSLLQGVATFL